MSEPAILAEHISKRYRVGERERYRTLREAMARAASSAFRRARRSRAATEHRALDDVSFAVQPGEIVGLIGRNGAGKTTLLKILARITKPTGGRAVLSGTVGSLLEVGTGFHPELTGRENISLSGAVLGMRRAELARKFDEIVAFAGVERFIDTPVKRYSSGMQVRLGFSVAAHLEPEILLIDEVLAVGDAEFQKKCLGRMEEVRAAGRTILFVSHNMPSVLRLCPRVILLDGGRIVADGRSQDVVRTYLDTGLGTTAAREWSGEDTPGDEVVKLRNVRVRSQGEVTEHVDIRHPVDVEVEYELMTTDTNAQPCVTLQVVNDDGVVVFVTSEFSFPEHRRRPRRAGRTRATCHIPGNLLAEGRFFVSVVLATLSPPVGHARVEDAVSFLVVDSPTGDSVRADLGIEWAGVVRPLLDWTVDDA